MLLGVVILLAFAIAGLWYWSVRKNPAELALTQTGRDPVLSESTRAILDRVGEPIEVRFYHILDTNTLPASLQAFATRVDRLLSEYERQAPDRIKVARLTLDTQAGTAREDGIRAFNLDRGDPSFLGIALQKDSKRESLPQLTPEWEPALEADLSRAIARLNDSRPETAPIASPTDPNVIESVRRAVPDLADISLSEANKRLLENAQSEFRRAGAEWIAKISEAQQKATEAQSRSQAEQQAALKHLVELQSQRAKEMSEIASRFEAQTKALDQLKSSSP